MTTIQSETTTEQSFDGSGGRVKTVESGFDENDQPWTTTTYYVRSSVLGGKVLTELSATGAKQRTYVYAAGQVLASQQVGYNNSQQVGWEHRDASNASLRLSGANGVNGGSELDPAGSDAGLYNPYLIDPDPPSDGGESLLPYPSVSNARLTGRMTYALEGVPVPVDMFLQRADSVFQGSMSFGLLEVAARNSIWVTGYKKTGVRLGEAFELNYDSNRWLTSERWEPFDINLGGPTTITTIFADSSSFWASVVPLKSDQQFQHAPRRGRPGQKGKKSRKQTKKEKQTVASPSACDRFAEELASRLYNAVVVEGGYNPNARHVLANEMNRQAPGNRDIRGVEYTKGVYPIDGFRNELTTKGQGADVYRHIFLRLGMRCMGRSLLTPKTQFSGPTTGNSQHVEGLSRILNCWMMMQG